MSARKTLHGANLTQSRSGTPCQVGRRPRAMSGAATHQAHDERNARDHQEYEEEHFRDLRGTRRYSREAKERRDQGDDEEDEGVSEHGARITECRRAET